LNTPSVSPGARRSPRRSLGFFGKLVALLCGVVLMAQLFTIAFVELAVRRSVSEQLEQELDVGMRVWDQFQQSRLDALVDGAAMLADDFGFRAAIASGDLATQHSAIVNQAARIDASAARVLDLDGRTLVRAGDGDVNEFDPEVFSSAQASGAASTLGMLDGKPQQIAVVPVLAPHVVAWVVVGHAIDQRMLADFRELTGLEVTLSRESGGQRERIASTLPGNIDAPPATGITHNAFSWNATDVSSYLDRSIVLRESAGEILQLDLHASLGDALAPYRRLQWQVLILTAIAALVALAIAVAIGRGVSRPVAELAHGARRIFEGEYDTKVPVRSSDELGELAQVFNRMQSGIAERERLIFHQASHDSLTGLPNRARALEAVEQAIAQEHATLAVMMVDIDRFKEINDILGHAFGDDVLVQAAQRLRTSLRKEDLVARLGGDEFVVLIRNVDSEEAKSRAFSLLGRLREPLTSGSTQVAIDASVGIALHPQHADDAATLLRRADIAMYAAKQSRAGVETYVAGRDEIHMRQLTLMADLRWALERNQITVRFQPKIDLASRQVRHAELLMRWYHPTLGQISPDEFIQLAERSGIIHQLTRYVLDRGIAECRRWDDLGLDLSVAINLSAIDLMDASLGDYIDDCLKRYRVDPHQVIIEVTESALMRDVDFAVRMLTRLKRAGIRLAIDDFGTGHSSLAQLKQLPVDELKIDKSFIMRLVEGSDDAVIVRSTIEIGHNMGLSVIAEGVENDESLELLTRYRCDMVQGYLFTHPLTSDEFLGWVSSYRSEAAACA
jgi:diguanylate cyclase (GGDEF)-like protein